MKKQYIFLIMIWVILYIFYLISTFTYKEYQISSHIEYITNLNEEIKKKIKEADSIIQYKQSKAYRNSVLKSQQSMKNKWEVVIYLTSEKKYNKFTNTGSEQEIVEEIEYLPNDITSSMTIFQKWMYFLFKKDIR
jgi:predicted PurR-regulated permease PerM